MNGSGDAYGHDPTLQLIFSSCFSFAPQALRPLYYAPAVIFFYFPMIVFRTGAASRAALRRPLSKAQINNIARRHTSTHPVAKQKAVDVTSNTTLPTQSPPPARPFWQRLGVVSRGISAYGRTQQKYPYRTQFVTSLVIYFLGDLSAQSISGDEYDPARSGRALVISAFSSIPSYKW